MDLSEMTIQYQGFHPSDFTKDYLESMIDELYTESPHGSFFQAVFSRQNHIFKARIRIDSVNGHFFAVASGRKLKDVTHRVVHQIRKQLGKWKSQRFHGRYSRQETRDFNLELAGEIPNRFGQSSNSNQQEQNQERDNDSFAFAPSSAS